MTGEVRWGLAALPWTGEANAARPGDFALHLAIDSCFCAQGAAQKLRSRGSPVVFATRTWLLSRSPWLSRPSCLLGTCVAAHQHRNESSARNLSQWTSMISPSGLSQTVDLTKLKKTAVPAFETSVREITSMWRSSCAQQLIAVSIPDRKSKCASTARVSLFLLLACLKPQVERSTDRHARSGEQMVFLATQCQRTMCSCPLSEKSRGLCARVIRYTRLQHDQVESLQSTQPSTARLQIHPSMQWSWEAGGAVLGLLTPSSKPESR